MNHLLSSSLAILISLSPVVLCQSYVELGLTVTTDSPKATYLLEMDVQNVPYNLTLQLHQVQQEMQSLGQRAQQVGVQNPFSPTSPALKGHLKLTSVEAKHNYEGWSRYLKDVLLFTDHDYHKAATIDMIPLVQHDYPEPTPTSHGTFTLGPVMRRNHVISQIATTTGSSAQTVGLYQSNDTHVLMQIGESDEQYSNTKGEKGVVGWEESIRDGVEHIAVSADALIVRIFNMQIYEQFTLSQEPLLFALRSDIDYITLPKAILRNLIDALSGRNISCTLPPPSKPTTCQPFNDVQATLSSLQLHFNTHQGPASLNISLRNLKHNETTLNIRLAQPTALSVGLPVILPKHYLVLDYSQRTLSFSQGNRFFSQIDSVFLGRFALAIFFIFVGLIVWIAIQQFFCHHRLKNKVTGLSRRGLEYETYEKPIEIEFE